MPPQPRLPLHSLRQILRRPTRRTYIAAPKPGSGPLLERRSDRALPQIQTSLLSSKWIRTLPIFAFIMVGSCAAIFNYQKQSSSVVNSTLYALRTNPKARELLGDEVYFASKIPWIAGEMNQLHGRIDISFNVKGTRGKGRMRFVSVRRTRMGLFETTDWSLEMEDGTKVSLLGSGGEDPFKQEEISDS
ncbi:Putative cytochrome c oxidase assembly factor 1 [Septoria linicola]|uniref:Cytochrome c oxidase assembly factor 1 n=1 Tax=Septoria linicola TaxID=215465 RepID=A0A9Q9EQ86_9PEZI|nr:putative cytochrome c oxidase assembly factor 1 [Septoria linicola]USW58532.1 Putative cytochrome c oxidase assembly factor 1 [Septoria linicola]